MFRMSLITNFSLGAIFEEDADVIDQFFRKLDPEGKSRAAGARRLASDLRAGKADAAANAAFLTAVLCKEAGK